MYNFHIHLTLLKRVKIRQLASDRGMILDRNEAAGLKI